MDVGSEQGKIIVREVNISGLQQSMVDMDPDLDPIKCIFLDWVQT